jgi:hypothetical protein
MANTPAVNGAVQARPVGQVSGPQGPAVKVSSAPSNANTQRLAAAHQHRAECTAHFRQALDSVVSAGVKDWIASAGSKQPSENLRRAQAFEAALVKGSTRLGLIEQIHGKGAVGDAEKVDGQNRQLETGTRVLSSIKTAQSRYQGSLEILQSASDGQAWQVAQDLADVVRDLRKTLKDNRASDGSLGIFNGSAAAAIEECIDQLAKVMSNHQRELEKGVRQKVQGQDHVKALFDARDQIDSKLMDLAGRLPKAGQPDLPEAAKQQIRDAVTKLTAERANFDHLIGKALIDGPPVAAPARRGLLARLPIPTKLKHYFDQQAVTRHAARGDAFKPAAGLDGRTALAAHLKGVFQAAGLRDADLPSRRELRTRIENWRPASPPPAAQPQAPIHQPKPAAAALGAALSQVGRLYEQAQPRLLAASGNAQEQLEVRRRVNQEAAKVLADTKAGNFRLPDQDEVKAKLEEFEKTDWDALEAELEHDNDMRELEALEADQESQEANAAHELNILEREDALQQARDGEEVDLLLQESDDAESEVDAKLNRMLADELAQSGNGAEMKQQIEAALGKRASPDQK